MNIAKPCTHSFRDRDPLFTNPLLSLLTVFSGHVISRLCIPALLYAFLPTVSISSISCDQIVCIRTYGLVSSSRPRIPLRIIRPGCSDNSTRSGGPGGRSCHRRLSSTLRFGPAQESLSGVPPTFNNSRIIFSIGHWRPCLSFVPPPLLSARLATRYTSCLSQKVKIKPAQAARSASRSGLGFLGDAIRSYTFRGSALGERISTLLLI